MTGPMTHSRPDRRVAFAEMPPELASLAEVATVLKVPKRTAARYVDRPGFPPPVDTLDVGRIWRRADVEKWGRENLPLPRGRPPKRPSE